MEEGGVRDGMERAKSSANWKALAALEIFGKSLFRRSPSVQKERNRQQGIAAASIRVNVYGCMCEWMDA